MILVFQQVEESTIISTFFDTSSEQAGARARCQAVRVFRGANQR
jgi:hypothetical protein